jgi:hypothetical protein
LLNRSSSILSIDGVGSNSKPPFGASAIQALLKHLEEVNAGIGEAPNGGFEFDPTPSIDKIEEERFSNQMIQQTQRGSR